MRHAIAVATLTLCLTALACAGPQATKLTVDVGGTERSYYLHTPPALERGAPLLLVFHGGGGSSGDKGKTLGRFTGLNAIADREGFVVAYPNSLAGNWNDGREGTGAVDTDDVAFVRAILDDVAENVDIDPARVYAAGISNGGFFSQRLACALSDRVAATYSIVGFIAETLAETCAPPRPVPVAIVAGTADPLVLFDGGQVAGDRGLALGAEATVEHWANHNGCTTERRVALDDVDESDGSTVEVVTHGDCDGGANVRFVRIEGGGHTWPSRAQYAPRFVIGPVNRDIDASEDLWAFVSAFSLPATGP